MRKAARKNDPAHVAAARELRDRWLKEFNSRRSALPEAAGKYDLTRIIDDPARIEGVEARLLAA